MNDDCTASPSPTMMRADARGKAWLDALAIAATVVLMVVSIYLVHRDQTRDSDQKIAVIMITSAIQEDNLPWFELNLAEYDPRLGFLLGRREGDCLTMLHLAVRRGNPKIVRMLVEAGDIPTVRDYAGMTAFEIAVHARTPAVIPTLYREPAAPASPAAGTGTAPDRPWCEALAAALRHGDEETAALIRAHAAPDDDLSDCR
ncbi:MAG: hypothetical protein ACKOES_06470 [Planctomycetaceae bacterium]